MYPKKTLSLAIAALSGCMALSAAYNVTGKLDNNGGSRIFLVTQTGKNTMDTIATSLTPDGSFTFTGNISAPMAAEIRSAGSYLHVPVMLEDGKSYKVTGDASTPNKWTIDGGGDLQNVRNRFHEIELEHTRRCDSIQHYYRSTYDLNDYFWVVQLKGALQREGEAFDAKRDSFAMANDNLVSAAVLASDVRKLINNKTVHQKYRLLGNNARNTVPGNILKVEAERMAQIVVGGTAPDFTMPTPSGETLSLHGVKAKIKILDFWASWCGPCKAAMPHLKEIYNAYNGKGLKIVGVNVWENDKADFEKAVETLELPWDMIYSAGRGAMDNAATAAYGVRGIPTIMLIDPEGTIVIRTYNGAEVVEKVHEVLGEKK